MRKIPVLFQPAMVQALLREIARPGTGKTMTRRLAEVPAKMPKGACFPSRYTQPSPWTKATPGDLLWVRETWRTSARFNDVKPIDMPRIVPLRFGADGEPDSKRWGKTRVSIHLPEKFSRITCIVTAVHTERLQDISEADAKAEGTFPKFEVDLATFVRGRTLPRSTHAIGFKHLWQEIHSRQSWDENPEVVVVTFKPVLENVDAVARKVAA